MSSIFIIAEAGVNHNGDLSLARRLVEAASQAGADAVKFQTFRAEALVSGKAPKAAYQIQTTGAGESQLEMVRRLELSREDHRRLVEECRRQKIKFLSTPFDEGSVDLLARELDLPVIKVGSGDITNLPLLYKVAQTGRRIILSTGMSDLSEVEEALGVLAFGFTGEGRSPSRAGFREAYASIRGQEALKGNVTLLHCTTEYPAPIADANLRCLETLRKAFGLPVGLSDHTPGITVAIAAAALGASVIEKHFTLDRGLPGPDHQASLEPAELSEMVQKVRDVEKALGSPAKIPAPSEEKNRAAARRSLVALKGIGRGERFTEENLGVKRPGTGLAPRLYWDLLGKSAARAYETDELIGDETTYED